METEKYTVGKFGTWSERTRMNKEFIDLIGKSFGYPVFVTYKDGLSRDCSFFIKESDAETFMKMKNEEVAKRDG